MFIVAIAFGILSGVIAAAAALFAGYGLLTAFVVYVVAGIVGTVLTAVYSLIPKQSHTTKAGVTQRS
ncbi:hypothetical protein [Cognatiyoonia sp. IB215182]|uniref:hypothetical protein n=1 Tax=Cognatiyoonia sp. IB215182 TaxID=3097353 RepID=UPI002A146336|nr:hypothetical protein [Cognatiyoonia sp. IB215182]MDX8353117.1 hypothetical protein [Cognatiyoonia sp. IB215182]